MKSNTTINFKTIAVDFDGTLCYSKWPDLGQPNQTLSNCLKNEITITMAKISRILHSYTSI